MPPHPSVMLPLCTLGYQISCVSLQIGEIIFGEATYLAFVLWVNWNYAKASLMIGSGKVLGCVMYVCVMV